MCPHGYHHSGSMATPALGTRESLRTIIAPSLLRLLLGYSGAGVLILFTVHLYHCTVVRDDVKCRAILCSASGRNAL